MLLRDFLGVPYKVGQYVAAGGNGNSAAEYGMILYRVLDVSPKLKLIRLSVSYPDHKHPSISISKVTAKNTNKYVGVTPPSYIINLFEQAVLGHLTQEQEEIIGRWVHGADHQVNLFV